MKVQLLMFLLLLLLCSTQVLTLRCYTCEDSNCKTATECPDSAQYCKTVLNEGEIVSQTCEDICDEQEYPATSCCQDDLCNE
ncbi:lymphocyte antigen 6D [Symphorus nematophorus]